MIITHKLALDLCRPGSPPRVDAVQGDSNTRKVEITLTSNGVSWQVPVGSTAAAYLPTKRRQTGRRTISLQARSPQTAPYC